MNRHTNYLIGVMGLIVMFFYQLNSAEDNPLEGRWDIVISQEGNELPSWLEIRHSGHNTFIGRFVYAFGSARPIAEINITDASFSFSIPKQWEPEGVDMSFEGEIVDDKLQGSMIYTNGKKYDWKGTRSPLQPYVANPKWGEPIHLFNGKNLDGWNTKGENQWIVESGILKSPKSGVNLISDETFMNYKLHAEFRYSENGNSGIYLRGRYEVQIADNKGHQPSDIYFGGVYGFLTPNQMVAKNPGEWQTFDIIHNGNRVSIVANEIPIITDQIIPGITGGAINSNEGEPGPFFIQGDHGPVEFRSFVVTPMLN